MKKCSKIKLKLLELIAASGEAERFYLSFISTCTKDYIRQNLSELKADNLIREYKIEGVRTYRLTSEGKKFLTELNPTRFENFFVGTGAVNKPRSDPGRRDRILKTSQAIILFGQTNVKIFPDEKFLLYKDSVITRADNTDGINFLAEKSIAEFYTSAELKEMFIEFKKARGSRAIGLLITKSFVYIVYNTGEVPIKWQEQTEIKFKVAVEKEIVRKIFKGKKEIKWLVLGSGYKIPTMLLDKSRQGKETYINIHYDNLGKVFVDIKNRNHMRSLKMIADENFYDYLVKRIKEDYGFNVRGNSRFNTFDEDGYPVLIAMHFDLRLANDFIQHLYNNKQSGNVACLHNYRFILSEMKGKVSLGMYDININQYEEEYENAKTN